MDPGMQHIEARRRIFTKLEPFPHPSGMRRTFDYVMYAVGLLAPVALFPQVLTLYQEQNASGLFLPTWLLLGTINGLWAVYGALHKERPVVIANVGLCILNYLIVLGIILYG